jgi:hypothetical protein
MLKYIYSRYQDDVMIILAICIGPWKAAKIMSAFDIILKEVGALSKNGFVLKRDGQVIYKGNAFLMGVTGGVSGVAEITGYPGNYQIIV